MPLSRTLRSAAIAGAGAGLGRDIALRAAARGCLVFGTATSAAEVENLKQASGGRVSLAVCDITNEHVVKAWAAGVSDALGETGLDLLITNAGMLTAGPIELLPLDSIRREFEVSVFGVLAVVNAFLPALRMARGRILQVGAWTAHLPLPFNAPSSAAQAAMEVFATAYRAELERFGIDVVVAIIANPMTAAPAETAAELARVSDRMTPDGRGLYGRALDRVAAKLSGMRGLATTETAERLVELAEQRRAPRFAPIGRDVEDILRVVRDGSDDEQDALRRRLAGLG